MPCVPSTGCPLPAATRPRPGTRGLPHLLSLRPPLRALRGLTPPPPRRRPFHPFHLPAATTSTSTSASAPRPSGKGGEKRSPPVLQPIPAQRRRLRQPPIGRERRVGGASGSRAPCPEQGRGLGLGPGAGDAAAGGGAGGGLPAAAGHGRRHLPARLLPHSRARPAAGGAPRGRPRRARPARLR